jgi:hypothetical protein
VAGNWLKDETGASFRTLVCHALLVLGVIVTEIAVDFLVTKADETKALKLDPEFTHRVHLVTKLSIGPLLGILVVGVLFCFVIQAWQTVAEQLHELRVKGMRQKNERQTLKETFEREAALRRLGATAAVSPINTSPPKSDAIKTGEHHP